MNLVLVEEALYKGHEIAVSLLKRCGRFVCDVATGSGEGEIIGTFEGIETSEDARLIGKAFVDGLLNQGG